MINGWKHLTENQLKHLNENHINDTYWFGSCRTAQDELSIKCLECIDIENTLKSNGINILHIVGYIQRSKIDK